MATCQLVQKHFVALFHPKPNEFLRFDLESCNLMCTYTVVTHPRHIPPLSPWFFASTLVSKISHLCKVLPSHSINPSYDLARTTMPLIVYTRRSCISRGGWKLVISLVQPPCTFGEKQYGEQSRISWAYFHLYSSIRTFLSGFPQKN